MGIGLPFPSLLVFHVKASTSDLQLVLMSKNRLVRCKCEIGECFTCGVSYYSLLDFSLQRCKPWRFSWELSHFVWLVNKQTNH